MHENWEYKINKAWMEFSVGLASKRYDSRPIKKMIVRITE